MSTIVEQARQAELALAAYADIGTSYKNSLIEVGFSEDQADKFIEKYAVVSQFNSVETGLSVTVFEDNKVTQFNFIGLTSAFDAAITIDPTLTNWSLSSSILQFHLGGSDSAAIGGDLTYQYAKNGNLSDISMAAAQAVLGNVDFGTASQVFQQANAQQNLPVG